MAVVYLAEDPRLGRKVALKVLAFDIEAGRWAPLPAMPTPRHGLGVAALGETLYALTGASSPGHSGSTAAAEALDFE
jgi:non-specific serine/threonine protein kinase